MIRFQLIKYDIYCKNEINESICHQYHMAKLNTGRVIWKTNKPVFIGNKKAKGYSFSFSRFFLMQIYSTKKRRAKKKAPPKVIKRYSTYE